MDSIAVTRPHMAVLSQGRLPLSPFGALAQAFAEEVLARAERAKKRKPIILVKDVRFFLNTVTKGLNLMKTAGVDAACARQDTEDAILLTIRIPKQAGG